MIVNINELQCMLERASTLLWADVITTQDMKPQCVIRRVSAEGFV